MNPPSWQLTIRNKRIGEGFHTVSGYYEGLLMGSNSNRNTFKARCGSTMGKVEGLSSPSVKRRWGAATATYSFINSKFTRRHLDTEVLDCYRGHHSTDLVKVVLTQHSPSLLQTPFLIDRRIYSDHVKGPAQALSQQLRHRCKRWVYHSVYWCGETILRQ